MPRHIEIAVVLGAVLLWASLATAVCAAALALGGLWAFVPTFIAVEYFSLLGFISWLDA